MNEKKRRQQLWEEWDGQYVGNIWGWRFSYIGLCIIIGMLLLMWYRYRTLDTTQSTEPTEMIEEQNRANKTK